MLGEVPLQVTIITSRSVVRCLLLLASAPLSLIPGAGAY